MTSTSEMLSSFAIVVSFAVIINPFVTLHRLTVFTPEFNEEFIPETLPASSELYSCPGRWQIWAASKPSFVARMKGPASSPTTRSSPDLRQYILVWLKEH